MDSFNRSQLVIFFINPFHSLVAVGALVVVFKGGWGRGRRGVGRGEKWGNLIQISWIIFTNVENGDITSM